MKILLLAFLFLPFSIVFSQIERGSLLQVENPPQLLEFCENDQINLFYLRNISDFLTNNDLTTYNSLPLPKRKKAFVRHVKHLNEELEEAYINKRKNDSTLQEIFSELLWYKASLIQKSQADAISKMTFTQKIRMLRDTQRSSRVFRYLIPNTNTESIVNSQVLFPSDPNDSPFWHKPSETLPIDTRFNRLAVEKKIKIKPEMVILFDKISTSGSGAKIDALDLDLDNEWSLKWGDEVHSDIAGSRIFAALGYDVDHPYFFGNELLTLIFDKNEEIFDKSTLVSALFKQYEIDITPFISSFGLVTVEMASQLKELEPFIGKNYVRFKKCAMEARPDRVKRLGSFVPDELLNEKRRELRGALLAHQFIGNWDTKETNTLLTTVHNGQHQYRPSAVFSDLGTSFGVSIHPMYGDFKVGLVNAFEWEVAQIKRTKIHFNNPINSILNCYQEARYEDLLWMACYIRELDEKTLRNILSEAHWPAPIAELYFHKLASRRASILEAFQLVDPYPIAFDKHLTIEENGVKVIDNGVLIIDYNRAFNPESFLFTKGRMRNYGTKK